MAERQERKKGCVILKKVLAALVAVLVLGTFGYVLIEKMPFADAALSAVSVMTTTGAPQNLSASGKLFTAALIIASIGIIVSALLKFFGPQARNEDEMLTGFFGTSPQDQSLIMKEVKVNSGSSLAGIRKSQIIQNYGVIVVGVKRKGGFDINAPLSMRVKAGSTVLLLGTPAMIMGVERKKKR